MNNKRAFTKHIKNEQETIRDGVQLLNFYRQKISDGASVNPSDLRLLVFALQALIESARTGKGKRMLIPALEGRCEPQEPGSDHLDLREPLLKLRMDVDSFERDTANKSPLAIRILECIEALQRHLAQENELLSHADRLLDDAEQALLLEQAKDMDATGHSNASKTILDQLKGTMGGFDA